MRESSHEEVVPQVSFSLGSALAISVVATLYLGILPGRVLDYARSAAELLH